MDSKESEKKYSGAPFGTQLGRFQVAGTHPKSRPPGSFTQVSYDKKSMLPLNRKLGPGLYNNDNGSFSQKNVAERASGPGWARAYETSQAAKIPHLLHKAEWEKKELQKCKLGPATYNIPDSFEDLKNKPKSTRGVCQTRAQRFPNSGVSEVPGPGTYGKGGIPHALLEEKQLKSASTVGMLDAGASGKRQLPEVGSALCPGQYNCKSFTEQLADRVISKRGPYDLFTGDRNKPILVGHLAAPNKGNLGPGEYEIKSFLDELDIKQKIHHGKFSKVDRAPDVPSDRIYCRTLSQWPRKRDEPGPGHYDLQDLSRPEAARRPPFGSSAERNDKKATTFFLGSNNPVGPGRYNISNWHDKQHKNATQSAFKSNTKRWDPTRDKYLRERIRSKDVMVKDRVFLVPNEA